MTAGPFPESNWAHSPRSNFFGRIRRRIALTIAASVGWLCAVLLFLAFFAGGFSLLQDIVVVVVSLLVLSAVLLGAWISFGFQFVGRWD